HFMTLDYLLVDEDYCHIENIQFEHEAANPYNGALVYVNAGVEWATFENCRFDGNNNVVYGLQFDATSKWLQVLNCYAVELAIGFAGSTNTEGTVFSNCQSYMCDIGFSQCSNLSSCIAEGDGSSSTGFDTCRRLSSCVGLESAIAYKSCRFLSSCRANGDGVVSDAGFRSCTYLSSCEAYSCTWGFQTCDGLSSSGAASCTNVWPGTTHRDPDSTFTL
ncbi:MAG: hypothetical protein NTV79_07370, partial [Candidatus Aureabacteria bacterium]|nr:hypothetical protein [Candidatus Auribacterota bacterium]